MNAIAPAQGTLAQQLARYVHDERIERIDAAAIARTKQIISYHVGRAFQAIRARDADAMNAVAIATELSEGVGSSSIIGHAQKATMVDAAFANCTMMRHRGLDDVIFPTGVHPGLVTLPVALAVAERRRCSGAELLTAIVAAYEIIGKFGRWNWSAETPRRSIMTFGAFASIAAAGRLLGLDRDQMTSAIGYAAHCAMGVAEGGLSGGPVIHFYSLVCRNGLTGAYICKGGGACSPYVLEGRYGFLETFFGSADFDRDALGASLGRDYQVLTSCEKRYPGTALNQVPIELMRDLIREHGLTADSIAQMNIAVPIERRNFDAGHFKGPFLARGAATSSVAFQMAIMLLDGDIDPARYEAFTAPEIQALVDKAEFEFVSGKPIRYTRLEIHTRDGRTIVAEGDDFMHPPEPPRTVMERDAGGLLPQAKIDRFVELLEDLENVKDASELVRCLVP